MSLFPPWPPVPPGWRVECPLSLQETVGYLSMPLLQDQQRTWPCVLRTYRKRHSVIEGKNSLKLPLGLLGDILRGARMLTYTSVEPQLCCSIFWHCSVKDRIQALFPGVPELWEGAGSLISFSFLSLTFPSFQGHSLHPWPLSSASQWISSAFAHQRVGLALLFTWQESISLKVCHKCGKLWNLTKQLLPVYIHF